MSAHPSEPLWRGCPGDLYFEIEYAMRGRRDLFPEEVEVWPAGSHPTPTREQVERALRNWLVRTSYVEFDWRYEDAAADGATDAVMALFSGVPAEAET